MTDDLQKAYTAYQQALYRLPNPKVSVTSLHSEVCIQADIRLPIGLETLVRNRYLVRSIWIA
jgi:hypothetical protein